jgi:hypothetical protein
MEGTMPRLRYIEEGEKTPHTRELIESAKRTGAPDPRVVSIMTRGQVGTGSVEYWNKVLYRNVPDQDLRRTPVRLLLDRALQRRAGRRPDRGNDQQPFHL